MSLTEPLIAIAILRSSR